MYRRLLSNTVLFSVSTFGSKILLFLLTPFYTSILTDAEYGVTDLIIQTGNVLIPLVSMGIINAVLRFGLEDGRPRTLEEVGKEFNVTRERIRQIEAKALRKLRHPSRSKKLKDFLN